MSDAATPARLLRESVASARAFASFYDQFAPSILVFFTRRVWDAQLAMDLTAETFARAFQARASFRGTTDDEATAWLYTIAKRQLGRYWRRGVAEQRAMRRLGVELPELTPLEQERIEDLAELAELRAFVRDQLARLPDKYRLAVQLRIVDETPYPRIAERLKISENAARARVSRGLNRLRATVERAQLEEQSGWQHD